jgi:AraC-like DNA-binding protein
MTAVLRARFLAVIDAFGPDLSLLDAEEAVTGFVAAMVREVVMDSPAESALPPAASGIADHVREQLHQDTLGRLDLTTLAREAGLSRYQVLRAFKRRYGLPPQSYRMRVRMAIAQRMLREGAAPAFVAAELGFVDQSHLTRHFKRVLGVTPAVYARSQVPMPAATGAERGWWRSAGSDRPRTSESGVHSLPLAIASSR